MAQGAAEGHGQAGRQPMRHGWPLRGEPAPQRPKRAGRNAPAARLARPIAPTGRALLPGSRPCPCPGRSPGLPDAGRARGRETSCSWAEAPPPRCLRRISGADSSMSPQSRARMGHVATQMGTRPRATSSVHMSHLEETPSSSTQGGSAVRAHGGAGLAADAGLLVDAHDAGGLVLRHGARGAVGHAGRIVAVVARYGHEIAEHAVGNVGALVVLLPGPALVVVHLAPQVLRGQMMGFLASDLAGLAARAAAGIEVESVSHDGPPFLFDAHGHDDGTLLVGTSSSGPSYFSTCTSVPVHDCDPPPEDLGA